MTKNTTRITAGFCCLRLLCACAVMWITEGKPAQALTPGKEIIRYGHNVWRTENGLPQNTVRAILQTRDGYIWLATDEGLARFDGLRFTVFDKQNTPEIKSNNIQVLYEDREGNLWIGTDKGLVRLKDRKFTAYSTREGLSSDNV